ncbi:MAG TPA: hypothetical protein VFK06_17020 [Candidatus Angelobacter sp.]|nr:hypothetical protein [Candidatus Angelobacter sp.]
MNTLTFIWAGPTPLVLELSKPIRQISVEFEPHGLPMFVTLWRKDGTGLRLSSDMRDVAERKEVGLLQFGHVSSPKVGETVVDISSAFNGPNTVFKLVIHESGASVESGVVLKASDDSEIVVVASASPYLLALSGVLPAPYTFKPEYPLDRYRRIPLT